MLNGDVYLYLDNYYLYKARCRNVVELNPLNTDNPIIDDYVNNSNDKRKSIDGFMSSMVVDMAYYGNFIPGSMPISYLMLDHEMKFDWFKVFDKIVFTEKAYYTFCAEYGEYFVNALDTKMTKKDCLCYLDPMSGDNVILRVMKLKMHNKMIMLNVNAKSILKLAEDIINDIRKLGEILNPDSPSCLLDMGGLNGESNEIKFMAYVNSNLKLRK